MKTETTYLLPTAAAILNVHPRTLKRWHKQGLLRLIELPGGHFRVPGDEITRLLAQPEQAPLTEQTTEA
jgi:putative resolvase